MIGSRPVSQCELLREVQEDPGELIEPWLLDNWLSVPSSVIEWNKEETYLWFCSIVDFSTTQRVGGGIRWEFSIDKESFVTGTTGTTGKIGRWSGIPFKSSLEKLTSSIEVWNEWTGSLSLEISILKSSSCSCDIVPRLMGDLVKNESPIKTGEQWRGKIQFCLSVTDKRIVSNSLKLMFVWSNTLNMNRSVAMVTYDNKILNIDNESNKTA